MARMFLKKLTRWDPTLEVNWKNVTPSPQCLHRVRKDLMAIFKEPSPGIFVVPDDNDMTLIHALLIGPTDTPYEGGFFYMLIRFPPDYPIRPPLVRVMTTGEGRVRFNPNIYSCGKICLSILGTWPGPSWSPAQNLQSVLISIQSLMNENPYFNEPGQKKEKHDGDAALYNQIIQHETLRVAVCDMVEGITADSRNLPESLRDVMEKSFGEFYQHYISATTTNMSLNLQRMRDPLYKACRGVFQYRILLYRLEKIKNKLKAKQP